MNDKLPMNRRTEMISENLTSILLVYYKEIDLIESG